MIKQSKRRMEERENVNYRREKPRYDHDQWKDEMNRREESDKIQYDMLEITPEIMDQAEKIQENIHHMIDMMVEKRPKAGYGDMRMTAIVVYIANLEERIKQLEISNYDRDTN